MEKTANKNHQQVGPRTWTKKELARAFAPFRNILKEMLEQAHPPADVISKALKSGQAEIEIREKLENIFKELVPLEVPNRFNDEPYEYVCIQDDSETNFDALDISSFELVSLITEGEKVTGPELLRRAKSISSFGRHQGQFMIDNWWQIPPDFCPDSDHSFEIALPGTLFLLPDGRLAMSCLSFFQSWKIPGDIHLLVVNLPDKDYDARWYAIRQRTTQPPSKGSKKRVKDSSQ